MRLLGWLLLLNGLAILAVVLVMNLLDKSKLEEEDFLNLPCASIFLVVFGAVILEINPRQRPESVDMATKKQQPVDSATPTGGTRTDEGDSN